MLEFWFISRGSVFSPREGALVLGGWNGRVFDGKCWWVLTESPSADRNGIPRHIHPPATRTSSRNKNTLRRRNLGLLGREDPNQYSQYSLDEGTASDTLTSWDVLKSWGWEDAGNIDSPGYVINLGNIDNLGR